jgi:hypothetical protein
MHTHKFEFKKKDVFIKKGKCIPIKIYQCNCGVVQIIDIDKAKIISVNGKYGTEVQL